MKDLSKAVALVTGATRGLGKGIALELAAAGATVYLTGRSESATQLPGTLKDTVEEINAAGGRGIAVRCDHGDHEQIAALFKQIQQDHGRLDVLVNNAFPTSTLTAAVGLTFWEHDVSVWDEIMGVGLRSHFIASRYAVPLMSEAGGLIVNVSSAGAKLYAYGVAYGVGKAGFDKFTADAATELAGTGISVVSIWPGVSRTELVEDMREREDPVLDTLMHGVADPVSVSVTGRAVVAMAQDPEVGQYSGQAVSVTRLNKHYFGG